MAISSKPTSGPEQLHGLPVIHARSVNTTRLIVTEQQFG